MLRIRQPAPFKRKEREGEDPEQDDANIKEKSSSRRGKRHQISRSFISALIFLRAHKLRLSVRVFVVILLLLLCSLYHYFVVRCSHPNNIHKNPKISTGATLQEMAFRKHLVVSMGTVDTRQEQVVQTVRSILKQTVLPAKIQIHYSSISNEGKAYPIDLVRERILQQHNDYDAASSSRGQRRIGHHGRTMSFLPSIEFYPGETQWRSANKLLGALKQNSTLIVTADDDFIYSPRWLESLLVGHLQFPNAAVGLRGWRVQPDLTWGAKRIGVGNVHHPDGVWGSFPATERYVILGSKLCQAYRVGVLTGVNGILYQSGKFGPEIFQAPYPLYMSMDDVWISGHLANHSIPRWVVPGFGTAGVHLGQHKSVIDLQNKGDSRYAVNNKVLRYFNAVWQKEDLFWSQDDAPVLAGFLPLRHWFSEHVIIGLHSVGWIRRAVGNWRLVDE